MDESTKNKLEKLGEHALHGAEDAADVVGHGVTGTVKGVADGVESASAQTKVRESDNEQAQD